MNSVTKSPILRHSDSMTSILMSSESYIDISAELAVDWACILAALHFSKPLLSDKQQMIK